MSVHRIPVVVTMLFCLPQAWPSTIDTFDYAPLALGAVPALADALAASPSGAPIETGTWSNPLSANCCVGVALRTGLSITHQAEHVDRGVARMANLSSLSQSRRIL